MTLREVHDHYRLALHQSTKDNCRQMTVRHLCKTDLFYLLRFGLNRVDADSQWVLDRCREYQAAPDGYIDLWWREGYKAKPLDEMVPTPTGWIKHGDLKLGDKVFGADGKLCTVIARTPVFTDADCYELEFDDGMRNVCSGDHLWTVERKSDKRQPGAWGKGLDRRLYRETVTICTREIAALDHRPDNRLSIRANASLELMEADLPISPYTMGAWLGDGDSNGNRLTCAYCDGQILGESRAEGVVVTEHQGSNKNTGRYILDAGVRGQKGTGMTPILRKLEVLDNKHIPMLYLRASIAQRLALLQGLMDTDGHCAKNGKATFCSHSERLSNDVYELATTLGLKPTRCAYHSKLPDGRGYDYWQVHFQAYQAMPTFRLTRKMARSKAGTRLNARHFIVACRRVKTVPVSCIQVDSADGNYLVGPSMIPTHNSSIITFAGIIQGLINDPERTYGIFSFTRPIAKTFLRQIKVELETNEGLKELFPEVFYREPKKEAIKWSEDDGIVVKRKNNPKESSVEAWGLTDGQPTSRHFTDLHYEDIVTIDTVRTPGMLAKTTEAFLNSLNLGTREGRRRAAGTRWHFNDTYATIIERGILKPRVWTATKDNTFTGEPWLLTPLQLAKKIADYGPYIAGAQLFLNPTQENLQGFDQAWLRYWQADRFDGLNVYILCDPACAKKVTSDYTVFVVLGLGADRNYYVMHWIRDRLSLVQKANILVSLHQKYRPRDVGYEVYGLQADVEHYRDRMERDNYRFGIKELGGKLPKEDRIKRLVPAFSQGRVYIPATSPYVQYDGVTVDLTKQFVNEEFSAFPYCVHDDMLDCLARILDPDFSAVFPQGREIDPLQLEKPDQPYDPLRYGL